MAPQSNQTIQNKTFPNVRSDINDNLEALFTQSSGASEPTTKVPFQPWVDTSTSPPVWKVRNAANSGWITVGILDPSGFQVGGVAPIANGGTGQTTATAALNALLPSQSGHAGEFLKSDGTNVDFAGAAAGVELQVFTSNGTYTPTTGKVGFLVICQGAGGGCGGSQDEDSGFYGSSGGGAGGCAIRVYNTTEMGADAAVTVGSGGANGSASGGSVPTSGSNGGSSTFNPAGTGATLTGNGGGGSTGFYNSSSAVLGQYSVAGLGGSGSGGQLNFNGQKGSNTQSNPTRWVAEETSSDNRDGYAEGSAGMRAAGGTSFFASGYGAGADGFWSSSDTSGGSGSDGVVVVLEF
jgi:hypothetical protein